MKLADLNTLSQKKIHRKLTDEWSSREELAEHMFMTEKQVSCLISTLRNKGIVIKSRPCKNLTRKQEYTLGKKGEFQTRKNDPNENVLLIMEMNHIRLISEEKGYKEILQIAERALEGCGLLTESTFDD